MENHNLSAALSAMKIRCSRGGNTIRIQSTADRLPELARLLDGLDLPVMIRTDSPAYRMWLEASK